MYRREREFQMDRGRTTETRLVAPMKPLMPQLNTKDGKLFVDETEVLEGYESFSGWYWFITERDAYGGGFTSPSSKEPTMNGDQ